MPSTSGLKRREYQRVWTGDSFAATLLTLFVDTYGGPDPSDPNDKTIKCLTWSPETILIEIADDFGVNPSSDNFHRLMTAITLVTTDSFFNSLPDFVMYCNILAGDSFDEAHWDPADAMDVAWGITEALLILPPDADEPFNQEILGYVGKVLDDEGIINPPDVLRIGLRDQNVAGKVHGEFSDDPAMFGAVYEYEHDKTDAINKYVKSNLRDLIGQLQALPLRSGNAVNIGKQLFQALG